MVDQPTLDNAQIVRRRIAFDFDRELGHDGLLLVSGRANRSATGDPRARDSWWPSREARPEAPRPARRAGPDAPLPGLPATPQAPRPARRSWRGTRPPAPTPEKPA